MKAESFHADDMDSQLYKVRTLELAGRREDALATMARCLKRGPTLFQFEWMPGIWKNSGKVLNLSEHGLFPTLLSSRYRNRRLAENTCREHSVLVTTA